LKVEASYISLQAFSGMWGAKSRGDAIVRNAFLGDQQKPYQKLHLACGGAPHFKEYVIIYNS